MATRHDDTPLRTLLAEETLRRAEQADLPTLADLDANGFLLGADEDAATFAQRLRTLLRNTDEVEDALATKGEYAFEELRLQRDDRIAPSRFEAIAPRTQALYRFAIRWVPGFYLDPSCSFLFGGAAIYQYPDFFTLFIIRRSFRHHDRWLIYSRDELLAHELCHVAHLALESRRFEETLAYQTSASAFRRAAGGTFYRPTDSFAFLGVALLLLLAQVIRTFALPWLPLWPFWLLLVAVFAGFALRQTHACRQLRRAQRQLTRRFGDEARPVLFRCTDAEIAALSALPADGSGLDDWLAARTSLRWQVIRARFDGATTATP